MLGYHTVASFGAQPCICGSTHVCSRSERVARGQGARMGTVEARGAAAVAEALTHNEWLTTLRLSDNALQVQRGRAR